MVTPEESAATRIQNHFSDTAFQLRGNGWAKELIEYTTRIEARWRDFSSLLVYDGRLTKERKRTMTQWGNWFRRAQERGMALQYYADNGRWAQTNHLTQINRMMAINYARPAPEELEGKCFLNYCLFQMLDPLALPAYDGDHVIAYCPNILGVRTPGYLVDPGSTISFWIRVGDVHRWRGNIVETGADWFDFLRDFSFVTKWLPNP